MQGQVLWHRQGLGVDLSFVVWGLRVAGLSLHQALVVIYVHIHVHIHTRTRIDDLDS